MNTSGNANHLQTAYDYEAQRWLAGPAATRALVRQLNSELVVLTSDRRLEYARFVGMSEAGLAEAERNVRQKLRELTSV